MSLCVSRRTNGFRSLKDKDKAKKKLFNAQLVQFELISGDTKLSDVFVNQSIILSRTRTRRGPVSAPKHFQRRATDDAFMFYNNDHAYAKPKITEF